MIHDLGIILLTAGAVSLLFKFLKQPVVLGYILAGMLVGPYLAGRAWIDDVESVETWGNVGVIFLLFSLGLEFSFKKLVQVGTTAFVGCMTIVIGMMTTGFLVGRALGFNEMNALFLGGMLCMSSTTIVFKALDDLGLRQQQFASVAFGILIVEDLFAVVLMVLLASIAVKQSFEGGEMLWQVGKLAAYLLFWFVAGIMLIPTFLKKCRAHLNDETLTIVSIGLCLGMVLLAEGAGFSAALGAFVMGSILAETVEAEHIEHLIKPVKDIFGAVFFVSVGMMIDPQLLLDYWLPITLITLVVLLGQMVYCTLGVVLAGQPLKVAMQTSFSMMQVGEFAFIIAAFGQSIGVTEPYLYPVIVAVSVITTFLTPYTIRLALPAYGVLSRVLPARLQLWLERRAATRGTLPIESAWRRLLKKVALTLAIHAVVCIFIMVLYFQYVNPWVIRMLDATALPDWASRAASLLLLLFLLSPFVYQMATKHQHAPEAEELRHSRFGRGGLVAVTILRLLLSLGTVLYAVTHIFTLTSAVAVGVAVLLLVGLFYSRRVQKSSSRIEQNFLENINAREAAQDRKRIVGRQLEHQLLAHDLHLADFALSPDSDYCGRQLMDLDLRRKSGVTVVRIVRGDRNINVPGGSVRLYPHDQIVVAGSDDEVRRFRDELAQHEHKAPADEGERRIPVSLEQFAVTAEMPFCGKTLAQSHIRDRAQCAVLAVEHDGVETINPDPQTVLHEGDLLTIAGEAPRIRAFLTRFDSAPRQA